MKLKERVMKMKQQRLKVLILTEKLENFAKRSSFNHPCSECFEIASNYYMKISELEKECVKFKMILNENLSNYELTFISYMLAYNVLQTCSLLKISRRKYYRIIEKIEKEMSGKWQD